MQKSSSTRKILVGIALASVLALAATPAMAQPQYAQGQPPQGMAQEFDAQTLDKFANAAVEMGQIQNEFAAKLQGVQDEGEAIQMQEEASRKMVQAVEAQGLDVQTYNQIANQAAVDPELKNRLDQLITQKISN